jgi:hypothetical protein
VERIPGATISMTAELVFVDTNVLVYARDSRELEKQQRYDPVFALAASLLHLGRFAEVGPLADRLAALDPSRPEAAQLRNFIARQTSAGARALPARP